MNCLPIDTLCDVQMYMEMAYESSQADEFVNSNSFSIGVFNGRKYTYTWIFGYPSILVESVQMSVKDRDYFPADVLVSGASN